MPSSLLCIVAWVRRMWSGGEAAKKEHTAKLCSHTDIDGSTGSTRCALGRGTSICTTCCGRRTLINRGRRLPHGAGNGFSWSVVSSSLGTSGSGIVGLPFGVAGAKTSLEAARTIMSNDLSNRQAFLSSAGRAKLASDIKTVEANADNASAILQGSLGMSVFRYVPYLNDKPNGILNLVDDVRTTAVTGASLLQRVNTLVAQSNGTTVSLSALQSLQRSVADATTTMSSLNRPAGGLIGPIGTARRDFDEQIEKITDRLGRGDRTLSYVLSFLGQTELAPT